MQRILVTGLLLLLLFIWVLANYYLLLKRQIPISGYAHHTLTGRIDSLPKYKNHHLSFSVALIKLDKKKQSGRIRLSWYGHSPFLHESEIWHLAVKIKPATVQKKYSNFNYGRWLLLHNFQAVGYVKKSHDNRLCRSNSESSFHYQVNIWRNAIKSDIKKSLKNSRFQHESGLISALTVGLKQGISNQQWQSFRDTGTSHLMAISGLHIGLCAAFFYWLCNGLWRLSETCMLRLPAQKAGFFGAWLAALAYSLMAGFALPTQRAFIMISCVLLAKLLNRNLTVLRSLMIAFCLILVCEPMAILSASFWMSFSAVALIIYAIQARVNCHYNFWWRYGRVQWVITLGLIPISLWFFQQSSLSALFANIFAIPYVSFIIVPLALLATIMLPVCFLVAKYLFKLTAIGLYLLLIVLHHIAILPHLVLHAQIENFSTFLLMFMSILFLLAPRGLPIKTVAYLVGVFIYLAIFV